MLSRRTFLHAAAGAAVLPGLARAAKEPAAMLPVIDTHQHLWDLTKVKLGWLKEDSPLLGQFTPKEYAEATDGLNVAKSVYMEVDVVDESRQIEIEYVTEICKAGKTPMAAAVVGGRPAGKDFATYAAKLRDNKYVKGVRQVLHGDSPKGFCLSKEFVNGIRLLGELGLSFDLCMRPDDLLDAAKLVELCPDTRFILDHCGNPQKGFDAKQLDQWKKDLAAVAGKKNAVVKVSGFVVNGWKKGEWKADDLAPFANATIDTFGVDRAMFGGDWPVVTNSGTYKEWLTALRAIIANRPEADQKKILHDNAAKFYGI
jgi:predicted TIM-barrel fold metal-dependent hydrolase